MHNLLHNYPDGACKWGKSVPHWALGPLCSRPPHVALCEPGRSAAPIGTPFSWEGGNDKPPRRTNASRFGQAEHPACWPGQVAGPGASRQWVATRHLGLSLVMMDPPAPSCSLSLSVKIKHFISLTRAISVHELKESGGLYF